jgi:hypothetical protein
MLTWQHFLEGRLGTCVESWIEQNARLDSQHKTNKFVCIK